MYRCPQCHQFASIGPGRCWKCGAALIADVNPASPGDALLVSATAGFVIRDAKGKVVTSDQHVAPLGGLEKWALSGVAAASTVSQLHIRFGPADAVVGDYVQTEKKSAVTPFQPTSANASFYWAQPGRIEVNIYAKVNGIAYRQTLFVKVTMPEVVTFRAQTKQTVLDIFLPEGREASSESLFHLSLGTTLDPGIVFDITISSMLEGKLSMLQLVRIDRPGHYSHELVLDQAVHYGFSPLDEPVAPLPQVPAANSGHSEHHDDDDYDNAFEKESASADSFGASSSRASSPDFLGTSSPRSSSPDSDGEDEIDAEILHIGLNVFQTIDGPRTLAGSNGRNKPQKHRAQVDEEYRMFVMYRPEGGIWVALAEITWHWRAMAIFNVDANVWQLHRHDSSWENRTLERNVSFCRLPLWARNASEWIGSDH